MRVKLTLEYDGTNYVGWQRQPTGPSIQSTLEETLQKLLGEKVIVVAAGRTDAGVHALGQVVAFSTTRQLPDMAYFRGLSGMLPEDIAVVKAEFVADDFDPRRAARGKHYRYFISNRLTRSPLRRRTHWEIFSPLNIDAMREASRALIGRHDFSAFRASNCEAKNAVREIRRLTVEAGPGEEIVIDVDGTAFLKHMVRNVVGTLVDVGRNKHPPEWVERVLASKKRDQAGPTAPAHGLTLVEVFYREVVQNSGEEFEEN